MPVWGAIGNYFMQANARALALIAAATPVTLRQASSPAILSGTPKNPVRTMLVAPSRDISRAIDVGRFVQAAPRAGHAA